MSSSDRVKNRRKEIEFSQRRSESGSLGAWNQRDNRSDRRAGLGEAGTVRGKQAEGKEEKGDACTVRGAIQGCDIESLSLPKSIEKFRGMNDKIDHVEVSFENPHICVDEFSFVLDI